MVDSPPAPPPAPAPAPAPSPAKKSVNFSEPSTAFLFRMKKAPEGSSHGLANGGKQDFFTKRFAASYEAWKISEGKEVEEKEEDRLVTDSTPEDPTTIFGFENEEKSMEHFLLDQKVYKDFKSLVILGEYGVGKTTLCKKIFNDDAIRTSYAPRIWVSMYSKDTIEGEDKKISVLKRILIDLGVEDELFATIHKEAQDEVETKRDSGEDDEETEIEKEISALLYALHLNLRWKKYLIVFDDVREVDNWNETLEEKLEENQKWGKYLSDGFPKGSGGRVIYTTREETLARKLVAEEHKIHRLWPLTDHQMVWNIYEKVILKNEKEPPRNDKKCIDELMNKSRGLPLAVRLIAELEPVFLDDETVIGTDASSTNGSTEQPNNQSSDQTSTST